MFTKTLADGTVHKLPEDMRKAILADKRMLAMWESITPLARNEWICWTITCMKPETRVKHIKVMRDKMHKGERRPCCWVGCIHRTDKAISPSVQSVLSRRTSSR
ncbi:MAG TPA: YdeI/OmpD-associated family protein [Candidatus Saccharimonadales bacterium]|nr:YdeI/OmpD-associated family protein [Candidatus Saccharimonadales bacterium]